MQITKMNITNPTLDQLIYKKEMSAEERLQEAEAKAKQEAEAKAKQEAEAKQGITVAKGLPPVTAAELADSAMNGLTDHAKKMKVALAKKFGITSFLMYRVGMMMELGMDMEQVCQSTLWFQ